MDDAATAELPARGRRAPGLVHREWPAHGGQAKVDLTLSRNERGGFSGHSGLSLLNRDVHALTEIQAFPLSRAPAEGKPDLVHLNGELP